MSSSWAWGIDRDHFVVARLNRGDWKNLGRCLQNPSLIVTAQSDIFDTGDLWREQRLLTHLLIGGVLTAGLWLIDDYWGIATTVTIYFHVLADLYSDLGARETVNEETSLRR